MSDIIQYQGDDIQVNIKIVEADLSLLYTDVVAKKIITLPANAMLLEINCKVLTEFDDSGFNSFDCGIIGELDCFTSGRNLPAGGLNPASSVPYHDQTFRDNMFIDVDTDVYATFEGLNGDATQGEMKFYFRYAILP